IARTSAGTYAGVKLGEWYNHNTPMFGIMADGRLQHKTGTTNPSTNLAEGQSFFRSDTHNALYYANSTWSPAILLGQTQSAPSATSIDLNGQSYTTTNSAGETVLSFTNDRNSSVGNYFAASKSRSGSFV